MAVELVRRALRVPRLTPTTSKVLIEYAERANAEHEAWGSAERIAEALHISTRSVKRARRALEARLLLMPLEDGGGRGNSTRYLVLPKPDNDTGNSDSLSPFHGKPGNPERVTNGDKQTVKNCHPNPKKNLRARGGPAVYGPAASRAAQKTDIDSAAVQLWLADHPDEAAEVRTEADRLLNGLGRLTLVPDRPEIRDKMVLSLAAKRMAG